MGSSRHADKFISSDLMAGQTLVEVIVALSLLSIGFLGMFKLISDSFGFSRLINDQYRATYLAAEGIEVVKNIIDTNIISSPPWNSGFADGYYEVEYRTDTFDQASQSLWKAKYLGDLTVSFDDIFNNAARPLTFDPVSFLYDYESSEVTPFKRVIRIKLDPNTPHPPDGEAIEVNSVVRFKIRGGSTQEVALEDHFYNWR